MALLTLRNISIGYGGDPLLDNASLHIERGDRACLVGRNGAGKSTLLKLLAGLENPDAGEVVRQADVRVAYMPQDIPADIAGSVRDIVESGDREHARTEAWEHADAAEQVISRLGLDAGASFETLSGGLKRRVLLARALVCRPDVLLLDEPTNHLDIDAIRWLETFLKRRVETFLFVTHDRAFLRRMASRIVDLDRGALAGWDCDYDTFLKRKQQLLDNEAAEWERNGKRLSREEAWIRQGIKARRTRDEGRVRALVELRDRFRKRRLQEGTSRIELQSAERSGRLVIKAESVSFAYESGPAIVSDLDARVIRGERVGVIGPNGSGKTTLLRLLIGQLAPTTGTVTLGTRLDVAHFDQLRATLDESRTVAENLADEADTIVVGGRRRSVYGYLRDFLFPPDRAKTPVHVISGGERNRLLLAKLFMQPTNLLVMDEPTNDLDIETLELLEEQLQLYDGTLLVVSHDRTFLNNVVTSTFVLEGGGRVGQYAGGYDDWLAQRPRRVTRQHERKPAAAGARPPKADRTRRFGFNEKYELERIEPKIHALEREQAELHAALCDPDFYRRPPDEQTGLQQRAEAVDVELENLIERWAQLEELAASAT